MDIVLAQVDHLDALTQLFNHYREFYQQPSDLEAATQFLRLWLQNQDSAILLAIADGQPAGFIQLYPSFSSVSMKPILILNDLFVEPNFRGQGIARSLMTVAEDFARSQGAVRLILSTQASNTSAQALYESLGYLRDNEFYHYELSLSPAASPPLELEPHQ